MLQGCDKKLLVLIVIALLCVVMLFVGMPGFDYPRSYYYFWDVGHLLCFALLAYLYCVWRPAANFWFQFTIVMSLTFLVGGATELIQAGLDRTASWSDLAKDLLGSMLALAYFSPSRRLLCRWQRRSVQGLVLLMVLWSLQPLALVVIDELIAQQQFPLLSGFEISSEAARWRGGSRQVLDHKIAYSGASSLRIELSTQLYAGVGLKHFPSDWRGFQAVRLHLYNPEREPLELFFRIHDQLHRQQKNAYTDRFNSSFVIVAGWNTIEIPLAQVAVAPKTRPMEMGRIAGMGLFVSKLERPRSFNIDEVLLVR